MVDAAAPVPVVAVVGRPNVGKSSLVNRIIGRREAIVERRPGVTRDRRSFDAEWSGRHFEIVDTGGLEPGADGLEARVVEQAHVAIETADAIVFVVDAAVGPNEDDMLVADLLRKAGKPVIVAANKVDDPGFAPAAAAFYRLGLGDPMPISALHGTGSGDLLSALVDALPEVGAAGTGPWGSTAIVGRPNVGKSSLLNRLLGETRSIVDPTPGTTRDPVHSDLGIGDGRVLRLVDTAGMRRRVQITDPIEYFSLLRSQGVLDRVDGTLLVVDVAEGVTAHDQRIADAIVEAGRACVVALNKWDLVAGSEADLKRLERDVQERLRFLPWAPVVRTSALTGRGLRRIVPAVVDAIDAHRERLPTAVVNRIVRDAQDRRPHPRRGRRATRILYSVQAGAGPPTIVLFTTGRLDDGYVRYIENQIRVTAPFRGTPLNLQVRVRSRRDAPARSRAGTPRPS